eukprot:CAMPEP_0171875562 /NCGR_PEP_ID=MMETSP0992-20121227/35616_1 /TAXON_ID=483369 /ORGANISM="non described non described, Strain CCMP2098" /LENGTH=64 /DNA_ID=CAMNT_0012500527 /DNA_START=187 /DNA_END=378 /DNA_ORIENTATION=-
MASASTAGATFASSTVSAGAPPSFFEGLAQPTLGAHCKKHTAQIGAGTNSPSNGKLAACTQQST